MISHSEMVRGCKRLRSAWLRTLLDMIWCSLNYCLLSVLPQACLILWFEQHLLVFLGSLGYLVALATHRFLEILAVLLVQLDRFPPLSHLCL